MAAKHNTTIEEKRTYYHLIPLIVILAFLPLCSRLYDYNPNLAQFSWFPPITIASDVFLYYKSQIFVLASIAMALLIAGKLFIADKKPYTPAALFPLAAYIGLALLSSLLSPYRSFSFSGIYEQFESIWVIMGYGVTAYYAYLFVKDERDIRFLMRCFAAGIFLMTALGLSQAFGHDFFQSELGRKFLTPDPARQETLRFNFGLGRVYMALYNPNYVGYYAAFIIPILLCTIAFFRPGKGRKTERVFEIVELLVFGLLIVGLFYCLIKSQAKNGVVALCVALLFIAVIAFCKLRKHWYLGILFLALTAGGFLYADKALNHIVSNAVKLMFQSEPKTYTLQDIQLNQDNVTITYKGNDLILAIIESEFSFNLSATDSDGNGIPLTDTADFSYAIEDGRFSNIALSFYPIDDYLAVEVKVDGTSWYFADGGEGYLYRNPYGNWCQFETAPSVLFTNRENIASGRGYIWSRTIPLLKKYVLLGSGADTFAIAFPNDDYVGMYNSGYHAMTMTKPHNMYLQIGVQTGVLSLLAFLAFYVIYFISSFVTYIKCDFRSYEARIGLGVFVGSIGYMISGIINDSTITVAPIYWAMIGVGIGINTRLTGKRLNDGK